MEQSKQFNAIDLFAGAGGFGLGFQLADYRLALSLEIDAWAVDTLEVNNPDTQVIHDDIQNYHKPVKIRSLYKDSPDIIIGGPPCQGFTIAGPAQKDPNDPRNSLFMDFARWVEVLRPTVFVMENVKGILYRCNADGVKVKDIIEKTFTDLGYDVEVWILNAAEYGVPQLRERVFIVGNRLSIAEIGPPPKTHSLANLNGCQLMDNKCLRPAITVAEAICDLPELEARMGEEEQFYTSLPKTDYQRWARGSQEILFNHVAMNHSKRLVERFKHINWGQSGSDAPKEHSARKRSNGEELSDSVYNSNNRRLHPHKPSYTIPAYFYSSFIHPYQHRNLTAREAARIQSFPDSYRFMGKRTVISRKLLRRQGRLDDDHLSQYNQIGNAVPPLLAKAIAKHIAEAVLLKNTEPKRELLSNSS